MKLQRIHAIVAVLALVSVLAAACAPAAAPTPTPKPQPSAATATAAPTAVPPTAAPEPTEAEAEESYYFVYVPKLVHPFYEDVKAGIEKAIAEYAKRGVEIKFDWDAPPQADVLIHTQRLEAAISKQPDAICVSCLDPDADRPLIEQAAAAGIPMFGFDTECPGSPIKSFVGHADLLPDGASMADALAEAIGEDGPIAILMGSPGSVNHRKRVDGFKAQLENYPNIDIVAEEYDNDDLERAINLTASILQAHPDLEGIFGCNSTAPVGAGRAIVEAGKKGEVALVGIGDLPEMIDFIKDGTALATSVQPVPQIGYWSINYMIEYLRGNVVPELHDTGSQVVDASNADTYKSAVEPKTSLYLVYVPKLVHPFYEDVKAGIEMAIADLTKGGAEVKFDWDAPPQADVLIHTQRLEAAISKQPDAICVSCLDPDADRPLIEQAAAAGIPMFGFDTQCPGSPIISFVGHANLLPDGASMADALAEAIGEDGPIAILMGSPGSVNHRKRVDGFKAQLENYPNIDIVAEEYDNDDLERAINLTASILQAHPDLEGIFGCNSTAPVGAGRAIVEAGKKGEVALVGIGDLPEMIDFIKDGTALATSVQPVPQIGYWSIRYMYEYLNGNVLPPLFDTGSMVVDASNADTYK